MPDKIVEVPGVGNVAFPETMTDAQIEGAIPSLIPKPAVVVGDDARNEASRLSNEGMKRDLGRISNMATMGYGGSQMGRFFGRPGQVIGGVLGAAGGAALPPSETPFTDLGATAGEALSSIAIPGGMAATRLARLFGLPAATGLGALAGASMDKTADFVHDTPWGKIGLYTAASLPSLILGAMSAKASPTADAAVRLKAATGVDFPLSFTEGTGKMQNFSQAMTQGTPQLRALGAAQDQAATAAFEAIAGAPVSSALDIIQAGTKAQQTIKTEINKPWVNIWKQLNATQKQVPSGVLGPNGQPVMTTKTIFPKEVNWSDYEKAFGLDKVAAEMGVDTKQIRDSLFRFLRKDPETAVNQLIPAGENQLRGLLKLRATLQVLETAGKTAEEGNLAQAVVFRLLRGPSERGLAFDGKAFAQRVEDASGQLQAVFNPKQNAALKDLADVVSAADPLEKVASKIPSAGQRVGSYLTNKIAFGAVSIGAGAAAGTGVGGQHLSALLIGAGAGAAAMIPLSTVTAYVLTHPDSSKLLVAASKGSSTAASKFLRTMISVGSRTEESDMEETPASSSRNRLKSLFVR